MLALATRHERVVLEAQDNFSSVMARAAVSTAALRRELDSLSRNAVQSSRAQQQTAVSIDRTHVSARRATASIDQLSGRVRILADVAAILGPSLAPIGTVAAAGVGGLVNQLALAALGAGTALIAFQGVGTALEAVNAAALEPTAENLAAAEKALADLAPAARTAVREMSALKPVLQGIRDQAAEGFFPGFTEMLDDFEARSGDIESVVHSLGTAMGDLMGDAGDSLAGRDWDQFFVFLAQDGARTLTTFGQTVGNLTKGLAQMWMAFDPLNDDFSDWLLKQSQEFDEWTDKLNESEGFREFVDYVRESGPQVASAFSEIGSALLQVMDAASPLGGPVLAGLEAVAKVVGTIADSDLGTPIMAGVAAMALLNRTMAVTAATSARMAAGGGMLGFLGGTAAGRGVSSARSSLSAARADVGALAAAWGTAGARTEREAARVSAASESLRSNLGGVARSAAPAAGALGAFALVSSGVADDVGLSNAAMGAMIGMLGGPWGAAIGAAGGALIDFTQISKDTFEALQQVNDMLAAQGGTATMTEMETLTAAYDQAIAKAEELKDAITNPDSFGDWMKGIKSGIEDMYGANDYEEVTREVDRASEQLETLRSEAERLADLELETAQWEEYTQAVARVSEEAEAAARAFINMGDSVNDSEVSLGGWLRELEANNKALRDFRKNAVEASKNGLADGLIADLQELGPEGARRMRELANASESEIGRANKAWREGERAISAYEAQVAGIPPRAVTDIEQHGMPKSLADIRSLINQYNLSPDQIATLVQLSGVQLAEGQLAALTRDRTTTVRVHTLTSSSQLGPTVQDRIQYGNVPKNADGGFVPKTGLPYADRHLYMLADGEGVTTNRNGETDRFRDVVEAINAGYSRAQVRGMLASGGIAGSSGPVAFRGGDVRIDGVWRDLERGIRILTRSVDKTEGTLGKARDGLDRIRDKMDEAGENSVDQLRPDLWAVPDGPSSPWVAQSTPTADPLGALRSSNADLVERRQLQSRLYKRGLRKGALAAALEGSNDDIESLLDNKQVAEFKRLYNRNSQLQTLTASEAGKYAYGKQERAQIAEVKDIKVDLRLLRKSQERTEKRDREWQKANKDVGKNAGKATSKTASRGRGKKR